MLGRRHDALALQLLTELRFEPVDGEIGGRHACTRNLNFQPQCNRLAIADLTNLMIAFRT